MDIKKVDKNVGNKLGDFKSNLELEKSLKHLFHIDETKEDKEKNKVEENKKNIAQFQDKRCSYDYLKRLMWVM